MKLICAAAALLLVGCTTTAKSYEYQMDYPVDAARLSLSGDARVLINCDTREVNVISDTSNGLFSRHIKNRISNICYQKKDTLNIVYHFDSAKGVDQDMIATHYPRVPPKSNTHKPGDGNS
ncbi:hypothetical protein ACQLRR_004241 [Escherichia coli]|uniref:hypothetical protein n=1 Tax=Escherichia coli TaxID=562 RepID=UPI0017B4030D|nr:hypothetical protein [Escherichia coli]EFG9986379.1 hypothetical protein [Escherichia coli]MCN5253963.1 hypothetical protein [Escherichia coli]MCN9011221.1 hypothetical protein [Escherichia coli]